MSNKILVISFDFIKKVNLRIYEELSKEKNFEISCLKPFKLNKHELNCDFNKIEKKLKVFNTETFFQHKRFTFFKNLKYFINSERPKVIIVHSDPVSFLTISVILYTFNKNIKIACISNENQLINNRGNFNLSKIIRYFFLLISNFIIKYKISNIFCISKQIKKNYEFLGYKKKTVLMPIGFDKKIFFFKKKLKKKTIIISYFGRICREKGLHILINALDKIKFDFNFYLDVDQIEDKKYYLDLLKHIKKNSFVKKIKKITCDHVSISNYMRKSDIVVVPSVYEEQYGRVIQESVACGSLVLGSNVGAIPEIIQDKDLIFENGNYEELAKKITKLKDKATYQKKFKKIYKQIITKRTLEAQKNILKQSKLFK